MEKLPERISNAIQDQAITTGFFKDLFSETGVPIKSIAAPLIGLAFDAEHTPKNAPAFNSDDDHDGHPILRFEAGEHTYIGNQCKLKFKNKDPVPPLEHKLELRNGLKLSYGEIVALGGDFYGDPEKPIADHDTSAGFMEAFNTLASRDESKKEAIEILNIMKEEIDAVNKALAEGRPPSEEYKKLGDRLSGKWNRATGGGSPISDFFPEGRYLKLALKNWDHFGEHAIKAYSFGHELACREAKAARGIADKHKQEKHLETAYAINAFADHFLSDLFSSGHLRTPRKDMVDALKLIAGEKARLALAGLLIRYMHDEDIINGLFVQNAKSPPQYWKAFGDKKFWDSVDTENAVRVVAAVQCSIDEVWATFDTGDMPSAFESLYLVPDIEEVSAYVDKNNYSPLFVKMNQTIACRNTLESLNDHSWTVKWVALSTMTKLLRLDHKSDAPATDLAPPGGQLIVEHGTTDQETQPNWIAGNEVRYAFCYYNIENHAHNPSVLGPWSDWKTLPLTGGYMPQLSLPTGPRNVTGRHIYRQFKDKPPERIGTIKNNTDNHFIDTKP